MPYSGHPTPDLPIVEVGFICKPIFVPDIPELWDCLYGQIAEMTQSHYWKQTGTMTPAQAAFLWARALGMTDLDEFCATEESDNCIGYPPNEPDIITYNPMNPFTQTGLVPDGYLFPPFYRFSQLVPGFVPDIVEGWILSAAEELTGYQPTDVLTFVNSFPFGANWFNDLANGLPRFTVSIPGRGRLLLHLLSVPLGGRALISVDIEYNPLDVINGVITDGFRLIELQRDLSSLPPELDIDHIEEFIFDEDDLPHEVNVMFLPTVDLDIIPLQFGGGVRKIEWCPREETDVPIDCDFVLSCLESNADLTALHQITLVAMENTTQQFLDDLANTYDGTNPNSINASIPTIAPDAAEQDALCYAIQSWLKLYAEAKKSKIRATGFIGQAWNGLQSAIVGAYGVLNNNLGFIIPDNLFSCFVDNAAALSALSNADALEEVKCCLYDELEGIALLETSLEGAISACVGSLTGVAQDIACVLDNDYTEAMALNFFFIYGRAIDDSLSGDCDCGTLTYPELVIGRCSDSFEAGSVVQISDSVWDVSSQVANPGSHSYLVIEDVLGRNFTITACVQTVGSGAFHDAIFYQSDCTQFNIPGDDPVTGWLNRIGKSYYAVKLGNNPYTLRVTLAPL